VLFYLDCLWGVSMKKIIFIVLIFVFLSGCSSFKQNENDPPSCNDKINFLRIIAKTNGVFNKSGTTAFMTLLTLSYADCKKDRTDIKKEKIFEDCKKMIYGEKLLPKSENYKRYTDFLECQKLYKSD